MRDGVYLRLFHGRTDPNAIVDDWGTDGPTIGPLEFVQVSYHNAPRLYAQGVEFWLDKHEDLILFRGVYYGDWSIVSEANPEAELIDPKALRGGA